VAAPLRRRQAELAREQRAREAAKTEAYLAAMQRRLSELQAELGSDQVAV
jgi:hypothetical protein